jgi:hypothetical protein
MVPVGCNRVENFPLPGDAVAVLMSSVLCSLVCSCVCVFLCVCVLVYVCSCVCVCWYKPTYYTASRIRYNNTIMYSTQSVVINDYATGVCIYYMSLFQVCMPLCYVGNSFIFFLCVCGTGVELRTSHLLGKCSTTWVKILALFVLVIFEIGSCLIALTSLTILLFMLLHVAGMIGMYHCAQLLVWMGSQTLFARVGLEPLSFRSLSSD